MKTKLKKIEGEKVLLCDDAIARTIPNCIDGLVFGCVNFSYGAETWIIVTDLESNKEVSTIYGAKLSDINKETSLGLEIIELLQNYKR